MHLYPHQMRNEIVKGNSNMTKEWYWHMPGMVYAGDGIYGSTERKARQQLREYLNVNRLPRGTAVWVKVLSTASNAERGW